MTAFTLQLAPESEAMILRHARAADDAPLALWEALQAAGNAGKDYVAKQVSLGNTGLTPRSGAQGLAGQIDSWPIDRASLIVAVGVPANYPAALYAGIQDRGGLITAKSGKNLAIPLTPEARASGGPRNMDGLTLLPRPGRPSLLVRQLKRAGKGGRTFVPEWVLVPSVRIRATGWFSRTVREGFQAMAEGFEAVWSKYLRRWSK